MKKLRLILTLLTFNFQLSTLFAQAPQAIPYQAVARDNAGNAIANQAVSLRFTIHDATSGGTIVYRETQSKTTNSLGLFTANIGQGTVVSGTFASINWGSGSKFMQVEMDAAGGTSYTDMGTQQMQSVPYALNAANGNFNKTGNDISNANSGNVGIGTTSPAISALLEVSSSSKGFLPPRMTYSQRDAISNPVMGLIICCTNCAATGEIQMFNGSSWTNIVGGTTSTAGIITITPTSCGQTWMLKNLNVDRYRNGDPIPKVTDPTIWASLTTGAYCYYNNDSTTYAAVYGKLYNWYAVNDPRGLAPLGWHVPSNAEWAALETCLGGSSVAGGKLKETGTTHWLAPNAGATNSSGFAGLPGGYRNFNGTFNVIGNYGYWWSSTEYNTSNAWNLYLNYGNGNSNRGGNNKQNGFSVRCLRD